jgi:hypothetical protein
MNKGMSMNKEQPIGPSGSGGMPGQMSGEITNIENLSLNNMDYQLPPNNSVCVNRVTKRNYFQNRTYTDAQTMICQFNTGTDSINCKNSRLVLKVQLTKADNFVGQAVTANFGNGSGINLIQNIRIYHRSGTTYTNTIKYNLYRAKVDHIKQTPSWFTSIGNPLVGYNEGIAFTYTGSGDPVQPLTQIIEIPLNLVHPFFDALSSPNLPSAMASGLRVEIDLATVGQAFKRGTAVAPPTATPDGYTILDCYFDLESVAIMDSAQATLNTVAQKQNLEYLYSDIFTSQNSQTSDSTIVNIDVNKSVALCESALGCNQFNFTQNAYALDSFSTSYFSGSWWFQLGSNQYPLVKVDLDKTAYAQALVCFDKFANSLEPSATTFANFLSSEGVYAQTFERDSAMALSASPINASRSLRFDLTRDSNLGSASIFTIFLTYITSARSTLLNSRVDI